MRQFLFITIAMFLLVLSARLYAETGINTSGQIRMRGEYGDKTDQLALLRTRIMFDAEIKDNAHAVIQFQDSRVIGNYTQDGEPASGSLNNGYSIDVHQAYLQVDQLWNKGVGLKAGRFEVNLGNQRVFGSVGWNNVGRAWEGVECWYSLNNLNIADVDLNGYWLKKLDRTHVGGVIDSADFDIVGLQAAVSSWNLQVFGFFELDALRKDTVPDWTPPPLPAAFSTEKYAMQRMNIGLYYQRDYKQFDFEMNTVYQFGKQVEWDSVATNTLEAVDVDIAAYMFTFEAGYTFDMVSMPRLAVGIDYTSGDDNPDDNKIETYDNLYYTGHKFRGYMDYFVAPDPDNPRPSDNSGLIDMMFLGRINPISGWTLSGNFHYFKFAKNYEYSGSETNDAGIEFDLTLSTGRIAGATLESGIGLFLESDAFAQSENPDPVFWGFTSIVVDF